MFSFRNLRAEPFRFCSWAVCAAVLSVCPPGRPALAGQSYTCAGCDFDHDGDIDQDDFAEIQACYTGADRAAGGPCTGARLDGDTDIDADDMLFFTACASGVAQPIRPGRLVIAELMASNSATIRDPDEAGDQYPDWFELYNDDSEPRELGGMYVTNAPGTPTLWQIPAGVRIEAGQRLLFWADNEPGQGPTHAAFKLDKNGGTLALFDTDGVTPLDSVTFGPLDTDVSWGRLPDAIDLWRAFRSPAAPPTPGDPNGSPGTPKVFLSEIMYHPYAALNQPEPLELEFVEIHNAAGRAIDLSGWRFTAGIDFTFPDETVLESGEYLAIARDVGAFQAAYPGVTRVLGGWTKRLSNDSDLLKIEDAAGHVIDRVQYADEGDWAVRQRGAMDRGHQGWDWYSPADGGGPSLELVNPALSNDFGHNWSPSAVAGGTPGAPNSVRSANVAPIIDSLDQTPIVPRSDETVQITARVIDELRNGLAVRVHYRTDGSAPFTAVDMADDGAHGDGAANDGVFGGQLPAQVDGTIVEYYVEAADDSGHARRKPSFAQPADQPLTNRLYQVDDSFTPILPAGSLPQYYLIMTDAERLELKDIGDETGDPSGEWDSNAQMNATFISVDGEGVKARYTVGIRNRGNGSRHPAPNNYRVNFVHDHPWNDLTELDINSRYPWAQMLGGRLYESAGLPAQDMTSIHLRVNGNDLAESGRRMYGQYVRLEATNGDFADRHFPDDGKGNMYRCISPQHDADLTYRGPDPADYREDYTKQSHAAEENWSDLIHLTDVLTNASDATYEEEVRAVVNVEQWARWFAMDTLLGNRETNLANGYGDDYYLYRGTLDTRFVLIPHDLDTILTRNATPPVTSDPLWRAATLPIVRRLLQHPAFCRLYYQQIRELSETVFAPEQLDPLVEELLAGTPAEVELPAVKQFAANRCAYLRAQIPAALTVQSDLPVSGGYHRTTQNQAALYGQGNAYDTRSITVNGQLAEWDHVAGTWRLGTSVGAGQNATLISRSSTWRYLDDGSNQGTAWAGPAYDESPFPWKGPQAARLGYGDDGETLPRLSYGPNASLKHWTYYFRRWFDVGDTSQFTALKLRLLRDDGAAVYINGAKVALPQTVDNMPDTIDWQTPASSTVDDDEDTFFEAAIPLSLLNANTSNLIAVEIHQRTQGSTDIGFDLELVAEAGEPIVTGGLPLEPGVNRVIVRAFDGPNGSGNEIESRETLVWYDDGSPLATLSGTIATDRTLDAASGPWHVVGDVLVEAGATLTIEPGTALFFEPGAGLQVRGRLAAEGTESAHIALTRMPGATGTWDGLAFNDTQQANVLSHVDLSYGDGQGHSIGVSYARLLLDHVTWSGVSTTMLEVLHPSIMVQNCVVPGAGDKELFHGESISGSEYFIIQNTTFGVPTGYNDVIDFSGCKRPGPILQIYNCTFLGGADDGPDLDGTDAHVEGNLFMNFHKGSGNPGTSNAISSGLRLGLVSEIVAVRNVFVDVDHALLLKEDCFARFENNTVVNAAVAVINFGEPERGYTPGKGAALENNIFFGYPLVFQNVTLNPGLQLTMNHTLVAASEHHYGVGNLDADPMFVNPPADLRLKPGSPAIGAGRNGLDLGAYVPAWASITGVPNGITDQTTASLNVWGPGLVKYRYRVRDNGVWSGWSADQDLAAPLLLTGLQDGHSYAVEVIAQNSAAAWQTESEATATPTWVVDTSP